MATVRLADDLNARMKAAAAKRRPPVSVTVLVAEACEQLLAGPPAPPPAAPAPAPAARAPEPQASSTTLARARRPTGIRGPVACPHPVGRRIGGVCMACGARP